MTICIAWRTNNKVKLCSDSRYSYFVKAESKLKYADIGAKIFEIPTQLTLHHQNVNQSKTIYNKTIGLAFAGDVTEAILIKDIFQTLLMNAEYLDLYSQKDAMLIAKIMKGISEYFTYHYLEGIGVNLEFTIFLVFQDIDTNYERCFRLDKHKVEQQIKLTEILNVDNDFDCAGSPRPCNAAFTKMNNIYSDGLPLADRPIKILQEIISSSGYDEIGGSIQAGEIKETNFKVIGSLNNSDYSKSNRISYNVMGINTADANFIKCVGDYTYNGSFLDL